MSQFRLADVKKTVRSRSDGRRYIHPKLLDGPAIAAQIELALAYFQSRRGQARHEFQSDMLVRFFGDPKVARGLVSCLDRIFRWKTLMFADVLSPRDIVALAAKDIHNPTDLRLYLYDRLNAGSDGFLPAERATNLLPLSRHLHLTPDRLDRLVTLDAEENAVLLRTAPIPDADHIIALYNNQVVAALLRHSATIELEHIDDATHAHLEEICAALDVTLTRSAKQTSCLANRADAFGSYARAGSRVLRALLIAAARRPDVLAHGQAHIPLPPAGKEAIYLLDRATLRALSSQTGRVLCTGGLEGFADDWARYRATCGTSGWRLVSLPDPVLSTAGLAVARFACQRDDTSVLLWPVYTAADQDNALALRATGVSVLPIYYGDTSATAKSSMADHSPFVDASGLQQNTPLAEAVIAALQKGWETTRIEPSAQALASLVEEVVARGFLSDDMVVAALDCTSIDDARRRISTLETTAAVYIPGLGLCSPTFAADMRRGLRRSRSKRTPAA